MPIHFDLEKTALLNIDLQKTSYQGKSWPLEDLDKTIKNAKKTIETCRNANIPIIYVVYQLDPEGTDKMKYEPTDEKGRPKHCVIGDEETEIIDEIKPVEGDIIVPKQKFTAWYGTKLDVVLSNMGIEHLIIFGVWTEACLETTVWDAIWRNYKITLVKDACGSATNDMHKIAVLDMANWLYGGSIINCDELLKALEGKDYRVWHFEEPAKFLYTLDNVESLYTSLD